MIGGERIGGSQPMQDSAEALIVLIGKVLVGLIAAATAFGKLADMLWKRRGSDRREDRENFESVNDRLEKENQRSWAENARLRQEIEEVRGALKVRIDQVHDLSNRLVQYQLEDDMRQHPEPPEPPTTPNEDGDPK